MQFDGNLDISYSIFLQGTLTNNDKNHPLPIFDLNVSKTNYSRNERTTSQGYLITFSAPKGK